MTAVPDEVATMARLGRCNPSSAEQFRQRRDSNGAKPRQTGQANARTDSIVAGVTQLTPRPPKIHVLASLPSARLAERETGGAIDRIDDGHVLDRVCRRRLHWFAAQHRGSESVELIRVGSATPEALDSFAVG
jgi:hypothetical protein